MMRPLASLAVLTVMAAAALANMARAADVSLLEPREFGYFLGDIVRRGVIVTAPAGTSLDVASLPQPGPVNYWLELKSVDLAESETSERVTFRITLAYQTFYAPLDPRRLTIPGFTLKLSHDGSSEEARVPEFGFVTSPLRELFAGKEGETNAVALQAHVPAPLEATGAERTALLVGAGTGAVALVLLALHYAWGPFRRRPGRPFTEAARFLRTHTAQLNGEGGYRAALIKLHRAFDLAAGRRVLPDDLRAFLKEHPQFAPLEGDIERLFACSREAFYSGEQARARTEMPLAAIADLGSRLALAERRAA
jgi:mxaA protein